MKVTLNEKGELVMYANIDEINLILRSLRYSWGGACFSQYNDEADKLINDICNSDVLESVDSDKK